MAWIESHQELARHPKTRRLARAINESIPTVLGHLHLLWWWALDFAEDGDLKPYSDQEIAEAAIWEGDATTFVQALTEVGFVNPDRTIHDWWDYAGKLIDQRKANADKQRAWRERQQSNRNVTVTLPTTLPLRNGATVPYSTVPNRTIPNNGADAPLIVPQELSEKPKAPERTPGQSLYLEKFCRKRFGTPDQAKAIAQIEADVGYPCLEKALTWAAEKNISDVGAIRTCAQKLAKGNGHARPNTLGDQLSSGGGPPAYNYCPLCLKAVIECRCKREPLDAWHNAVRAAGVDPPIARVTFAEMCLVRDKYGGDAYKWLGATGENG